MKVIYHCYGGTHSSVVAASIHTGLLPEKTLPDQQDLLNIELFDMVHQIKHGKLHYFGMDTLQHEVYSCGMKSSSDIVMTAMKDLLQQYGYNPNEELYFVDTLHCVNISMRVGGYMSQRLNLTSLGRPLVLHGTLRAYRELAHQVQKVKSELKKKG